MRHREIFHRQLWIMEGEDTSNFNSKKCVDILKGDMLMFASLTQ